MYEELGEKIIEAIGINSNSIDTYFTEKTTTKIVRRGIPVKRITVTVDIPYSKVIVRE